MNIKGIAIKAQKSSSKNEKKKGIIWDNIAVRILEIILRYCSVHIMQYFCLEFTHCNNEYWNKSLYYVSMWVYKVFVSCKKTITPWYTAFWYSFVIIYTDVLLLMRNNIIFMYV